MNMIYHTDKTRVRFPESSTTGGNFAKRDLPEIASKTLVASTRGAPAVLVRFTAHMSASRDASMVYGFIWVSNYDPARHPAKAKAGDYMGVAYINAGAGKAGGYGYHKTSAAFADALDHAGVVIEGRDKESGKWARVTIGGGGDSCIDAALYAIGEALGFKRDRLAIV